MANAQQLSSTQFNETNLDKYQMKQCLSKLFIMMIGVLTTLIVIGCGGGGGGSASTTLPPLPNFISGSVSEADRTRVISEVTTFFKSVSTQPDAMQQVTNFMKTKPEIVATEVSKSGDAVGWFKDGVKYMVLNSASRSGTRGRVTKSLNPQPLLDSNSRSLPGANKAYLIHIDVANLINSTASIDPILTQRGYDTIQLAGAISDFVQIQNAGVLYINTLGSYSRDRNEEERTWFMTATQNSVSNYQLYKEDIEAGTICPVTYIVDPTAEQRIYEEGFMVSDQFLKDSGISFSSKAIWINEVMFGAQESMIQTAYSFEGLESYWSWSGEFYSTEATETTQFVFARFLGTPVEPEDDLPPYTVGEIQSDIGTTNRASGPRKMNESDLGIFSKFSGYTSNDNSDSELTMIPSIRSAVLDKAENKMEIEGFFGSESGAVTIDGSTLNVLSWTPKTVIVEAPSATKGVIVLRSLGGPSASGQLLSKRFDWEDIDFSINPGVFTLLKRESKSFTVTSTGSAVPVGSTYKWTITGEGLVNGSTTFTGPDTTVTYQAPNVEGNVVLKVEVFTASGRKLGEAFSDIGVGENRIFYFASGLTNYPNLYGEHVFADGEGFLVRGQSTDLYEFDYNWDNVNELPRVVLSLEVPANTVLAAGQTYNWTSVLSVGYSFGTTESLTEPTLTGILLSYGSEGRMTITSAIRNPDGTQRVAYQFLIGPESEPTTVGTGSILIRDVSP